MKITRIGLIVLGVAWFGLYESVDGQPAVAPSVEEQQAVQASAGGDMLYDLVRQLRAELRELRLAAGLGAYAAGPRAGRPDSHAGAEGSGEHRGRREGGEGAGHGSREQRERARGNEEGSAYLPKMARQNQLFRNGTRLVLQFDPTTQVFVGSVTNTTARTLGQVRVEVHLDNGTELGPTKRIDLGPGQTAPVELGAFGNEFSAWVSHPEVGAEEGHGVGGEEGGEGVGEHGGREGSSKGPGEHGGGEDTRPRGASYRPVYNQLQVLRGEMHAFEVALAARSR
ncbi:MAG: hypothetical protein OXK77_18040 [Gemmatimonadota bacterium]|nr:hypothetical protein [Gemmatimonadota bacterium]MDE2865701.1 hypothetical protein [Gemmatimonadota bacterium]